MKKLKIRSFYYSCPIRTIKNCCKGLFIGLTMPIAILKKIMQLFLSFIQNLCRYLKKLTCSCCHRAFYSPAKEKRSDQKLFNENSCYLISSIIRMAEEDTLMPKNFEELFENFTAENTGLSFFNEPSLKKNLFDACCSCSKQKILFKIFLKTKENITKEKQKETAHLLTKKFLLDFMDKLR